VGNVNKPDFFLVGAPKCGTTAIYEYLRQHPDIFMPWQKERPYFSKDFYTPWNIPDLDAYLELFAGRRSEKKIGDAVASYLYSKRAAAEMGQVCPEARIIIMLRNPVEMIYSLHSQLVYNGDEPLTEFELALNAEEERKQGLQIPEGSYPVQSLFYREVGKYCEQIERYIAQFGRNNIHIIIHDDLRKDPLKVYQGLLSFLEVDRSFEPRLTVVNANKTVRSPGLRRFLRKPPKPLMWLSRPIPRRWRWAIESGIRRLNSRYQPRRAMDPELRRRLQTEFAAEVQQLSNLLNRDLSHWSRD